VRWGGWEVFWEEVVRLSSRCEFLVGMGHLYTECLWLEADRSVRPTRAYLLESRRDAGATLRGAVGLVLVAAAEVVDEHLFYGLVVGH
jgi:hypothetical protein